MKRILLPLLLSISLAATGCQTTSESEPIVATGQNVIVRSAQALIVAHNAYQGATAAAELAVKSGRLTDDQLIRLKALNDKALGLLAQADAGRDVALNAAQVMGVVAQINTLLKGDVR